MTRQVRLFLSLMLIAVTMFTGCHPTQPFYFHEDGDLSHYLDRATDLEFPDVNQERLAEVDQAHAPYRVSRPEEREFWDLPLEEAISLALQNSKIIQSVGGATNAPPDQLLRQPDSVISVWDPAIAETDTQSGVEQALSAFDAQLNVLGTSNGNFASTQDRPSTFAIGGGNAIIQQTTGGLRAELSKRSAGGTQYFVRSITEYTRGNTFGGLNQAVGSIWQQSIEAEVRQPILRGRGAGVNRVPVILARINTDISLAQFEANVRNMVFDVERTYWDLYFRYRAVETARIERDAAQKVWKTVDAKFNIGTADALQKAQADQQYFSFRAQLEDALRELYNTETTLRALMGLAPTDGRMIRPIDEPTIATVEFDWLAIQHESLIRSPELRRQKWAIQSREMALIASKNRLLPQFDLGATYRWYGIGDDLINAQRNGLNFPTAGSTAWDVLTEGDFQESAFFMQFQMPVGFRRELADVRNGQLLLARDRARLQEMELATTGLLTTTLHNLDGFHQLAQTRFNHWRAANDEFTAADALYVGGKTPLDQVLDSQRRRSEAQREYYRVLIEYNKAIAEVHYRKGSLLEYNNIQLAEGPWPDKAYWDAMGLARQRDASYYLDYGWSRPNVISQGPVEQQVDGELFPGEVFEGEGSLESIPQGEPTPATPRMGEPPAIDDGSPPVVPRPQPRETGPITSRPELPMLNAPTRASVTDGASSVMRTASASTKSFDWNAQAGPSESPPSRRTENPLR